VAIEAWLRSSGGFSYNEHPPQVRGMPPLVAFVTRTKQGYCQHFAGAMALMLRYLGIPARVAAGFTSGAYDADRGTWRVNDRNAHTWVEVWFNGYGWLPFDPTPGRGNLGGSYTTRRSRSTSPAWRTCSGRASARPPRATCFASSSDAARHGSRRNRPRAATSRRRAAAAASATGFPVAQVVHRLIALVLLFAVAKLVFRRSRFLTATRARSRPPAGASSSATCSTSESRFRGTSGSRSWARSS
jgi:hypothetical protein